MSFGKNLESACKSWTRADIIRLQNKANAAAEVANRYAVGSPEWKELVKDFVKAENTLNEFVARQPAWN
jgi:hypothetical protein